MRISAIREVETRVVLLCTGRKVLEAARERLVPNGARYQ